MEGRKGLDPAGNFLFHESFLIQLRQLPLKRGGCRVFRLQLRDNGHGGQSLGTPLSRSTRQTVCVPLLQVAATAMASCFS